MVRKLVLIALVIAAIAAYGTMLTRNICFAVGGSDSSGYMNEARAIAAGRTSLAIEPLRPLKLDDSFAGSRVGVSFRCRGAARRMDGGTVLCQPAEAGVFAGLVLVRAHRLDPGNGNAVVGDENVLAVLDRQARPASMKRLVKLDWSG